MKQLISFFCIALILPAVEVAATENENLLINGVFEAEAADFPEFWNPSSQKNVLYDPDGGPEGKASVCLSAAGPAPISVKLRQQGMVLVPGETYKLSGYIKTKGCKNLVAGVVLHNDNWTSSSGFVNLPADSDWTFKEKTFTLFPSSSKEYGLTMFAEHMTGEISFADLKLEAISEKARSQSVSQKDAATAPRLIPIRPLLNKITSSKTEINFLLCGSLPEIDDAYECVVSVDGNRIPTQVIPLTKSRNILVKLVELACGDHSLKAVLRQRETQKTILESTYPISIIDAPAIDCSRIKPLNNLVAEVLNQPLTDTTSPQSYSFVNPRDGWVFVALRDGNPAADFRVTIDGRDTVITAATDHLEAVRELPMGEHSICVSGNQGDARLLVRSIPEIFDYPPCQDSFVEENGHYDWNFMKEHMLYAVTTLNGGSLPGEALGEAKARGLKWLAVLSVVPTGNPPKLANRMGKSAGMTLPQYDGFTSDELYFARSSMDRYTKALRLFQNPKNRLIYTWIVGKPTIRTVHTDFISAALNVSKGRGRILYEAHCYPLADEKTATAYLNNMISEPMRRLESFFPGVAAGTGIIFGNYTQLPILSLDNDPAVDYKYYLDMQVNLIANSPDFKNLATTGYWGTYYGDEEIVRWSFMLMRHYAVEGKRDMLSHQYGFKYKPGCLKNCDFAEGLNNWTCEPAVRGSIRAERISGYGTNSQGRIGNVGAGDTVCAMKRCLVGPNRISQIARGLEVGKTYCLQFVTADFNDVVGKKYNPRKYGINVELKGAEILSGKGYVHIDKRRENANQGKINLNRIIFRAKSPTQTVVFSDEKAAVGETLIINYVQLKPYLEPEPRRAGS